MRRLIGVAVSQWDTFEQAERLYDEGHHRRAARLWTSLPNNPDAWFNAANSYAAIGDLPRATQWYRRAIASGVREAYLNYGQLLLNRGRRRKAIEAFREGAKRGDYGSAVAYAIELNADGKRTRAIALSRRLLDADDPRSSWAATVLADNLLALDPSSDEAVRLLERALPDDPSAASVLRTRLGGTPREDLAIRLLETALSDGHMNAAVPLGRLYEDKHHLPDAERAYKEGASLGDRNSLHNLGTLMVKSGRPEEGRQAIKQAAEAGDHLAKAWLEADRNEASQQPPTSRPSRPSPLRDGPIWLRPLDDGLCNARYGSAVSLKGGCLPGRESETILRRAADLRCVESRPAPNC